MQVIYFIHDTADAAVHKRVKMLHAGGADVSLLGFTRAEKAPADVESDPVIVLGRTYDRKLARRALSVLAAVFKLRRYRHQLASADVVMGRNLEMLVLAWTARSFYAPKARLVYECLDIHPAMLGSGMIGRILRALERHILTKGQLVITSSPAFKTEYFEARQHVKPPVLLIENKVLRFDGPARVTRPSINPGPPWRIGWYGIQRVQKALDILSRIAKDYPGLVEIVIRGRPSMIDFHDFHEQVAATPGVYFEGAYGPADLAKIYGDVHFNWAFDFFDEDNNSAWLLPNRIYEGGLYGSIPLTKRNNETGRWLSARTLGVLMDAPEIELPAFLKSLTPQAYEALAARARALPVGDVVADQRDCDALVAALKGKCLEYSH